MNELETKITRIRSLLEEQHLGALLLKRVSSFAWATCGAASYVNTAVTFGEASLLITPTRRYVLTNTIEAPRIEMEEGLAAQGWELIVLPWYEPPTVLSSIVGDGAIGADVSMPGVVDLTSQVAHLRATLTPEENTRFRTLGRLCSESMDRSIREIKPGMTEFEIAARLAQTTQSLGVQPIVNLIATDERIFHFRHPLPTAKKMDRYAMLVLCGRQSGLICSITRLVHFGRLTDELAVKSKAVAQIDATMIQETRPGKPLAQIFAKTQVGYREAGFDGEWKLHHQGGPAGYEAREYTVTPTSTEQVLKGQAYAWNPSITGAKSEDTILVGETENEIITNIDTWPMIHVTIGDNKIARPAILEVL